MVIMPKSLIYNWENEIKRFSPKLKTMRSNPQKEFIKVKQD